VLRPDESKLGWMVLDLRAAKMNAVRPGYLSSDGDWTTVMGVTAASVSQKSDFPALRLRYALRELPLRSADAAAAAAAAHPDAATTEATAAEPPQPAVSADTVVEGACACCRLCLLSASHCLLSVVDAATRG
jgi:hypothetical protein